MMERRRLLEMDTGYVKSGLVLWLDGIDRGGVSGEWHSLVGDAFATLYDNYTELSDGIYFPDQSPYGYGIVTNGIGIGYQRGTIEICVELLYYENIGRPTYCFANSNMGGSIMMSEQGNLNFRWWCRTGTSTPLLYTPDINNLKITASGNYLRGMGNGQESTFASSGAWTHTGGICYIAKRSQGNPFVGTMHSIRLYDRLLSHSEMLHNQKIDNKRFNLGLNI